MKPTTKSLLVLSGCILLTGCGERSPEVPKLHVYTWADYINPDLVPRFEEEHNCRVVIDTFDANEAMLAKLKAGATGYDILVPSSYMVKILEKEGMLQPLDHSKIPNLAHVDQGYLADLAFDKEMKWSVPYMLAPTGVGYIDGKVDASSQSWAVFDNPDLKGQITLLNDVRETLGAALKFLGYSLNTRDAAQIDEAGEVVIQWKKNIAKFESEQFNAGLASEEFLLVQGYAGDLFQAQEENEAVTVFVPKEGTSIACDDLVIPHDAPNADLAHAFINFLHEPAVCAENMEWIYYLGPNSAAYELVSEEFKENDVLFLEGERRQKSEMIDDLGEDNQKYNAVWDRVKAAAE